MLAKNSESPKAPMRLQKILSRSGVVSRRSAEKLILEGKVSVNDIVVKELGTKAIPGVDLIKVEGEIIQWNEQLTIVLNKPKNCITTIKDPQQRFSVGDLLKQWRIRLYPVGRLDYDSEGLIICTNDGELSYRLQHPRYGVTKVYEVKLSGKPLIKELNRFREGVELKEGIARADDLKVIRYTRSNCWIEITLHQGWNRQIKRMAKVLGYRVLKIKRVGFGPLKLSGLKPGEGRTLTNHELQSLYSAVGLKYGQKANG